MSPKKLRFILDDVRKMKPAVALSYLLYSPRRSSKVLYKVVKSAITAATTSLKTDDSMLQFKTLAVSEGPVLKRMRPGGRGMAKLYQKKSSQVLVVLDIDKKESAKKTTPVAKKPIISQRKVSKKTT
jgi:large subunit ribosomal protein L22